MNTGIPANIVLATELDIPVPSDALSCPCGCCTREDAANGTNCFDMRKAPVGHVELPPARLVIDHSIIPTADLAIALANAAMDPDGQVFPWQPAYPLIGSTVYYSFQLWTVAHRERGPGQDCDSKMVTLVGQGHAGWMTVTRGELRPITWSQGDENWLGVEA